MPSKPTQLQARSARILVAACTSSARPPSSTPPSTASSNSPPASPSLSKPSACIPDTGAPTSLTTGHVTANSRVVWRGWKFGLPTQHHTLITAYSPPNSTNDQPGSSRTPRNAAASPSSSTTTISPSSPTPPPATPPPNFATRSASPCPSVPSAESPHATCSSHHPPSLPPPLCPPQATRRGRRLATVRRRVVGLLLAFPLQDTLQRRSASQLTEVLS